MAYKIMRRAEWDRAGIQSATDHSAPCKESVAFVVANYGRDRLQIEEDTVIQGSCTYEIMSETAYAMPVSRLK